MKIICEKGYEAKQVLDFITEYIEKKSMEYPVIAEDMEIDISLKSTDGAVCPDNDRVIHIGQQEMNLVQNSRKDPNYYRNRDVLTGLYNRSQYEQDMNMFRITGYKKLVCAYIDVIGLHEINNHLGHSAGDQMLCSVADGIRKYFPNGMSYRIGGDEFIILCPDHTYDEITEKTDLLKQELRKQEYENSVGIGESTDRDTIDDMIDLAENAMRYDKMEFYRKNGGLRQMRSLNHKLEKLIIEKQDANHFLDVIAPRYKGVYIVNKEKDTCRYIYVPPYFQIMLDKNQGKFSGSMKEYCRVLVCPEYYDQFKKLLDYDYVQEQLALGNTVDLTYQKLDGTKIELKITIYDQEDSDIQEMLWIFQSVAIKK